MGRRGVDLGRYCENMVVKFLRRNGYKILERNYRSIFGEIDVIAKEDGCIVFVEIKSGSFPLFGPPYLKVDRKKREHIIKTALCYLKRHGLLEAKARIDVFSVTLYNKSHFIEIFKDAFGIT